MLVTISKSSVAILKFRKNVGMSLFETRFLLDGRFNFQLRQNL